MQKKLIIIAGPTAAGKTAVAIAVARHLQTEIISADSRQCYREMKIGVARPADEELAAVPHHFIASHSIHHPINAAGFEQYALEKAEVIFSQHDHAVVVGGTGLYIKALAEGLDAIPAIPEAVRNEVIGNYEIHGLAWLQEAVQEKDPLFYHSGEIMNPQRLMRALEVKLATGKSIREFQSGLQKQRLFDIIKIALELPRAELYNRINRRVDDMMLDGLEAEARSLYPFKHLAALQTVGYQELFDHFDGLHDLQTAVSLIKRNTRHYAKRQLTWFKKDKGFSWFAPSAEALLPSIEKQIRI